MQALESSGDRRAEYWRNRIQPFWQYVWPKSRNLASSEIAESLARLSIAAGAEFPSALQAVQDWLQPLEHPDYVVHQLRESNLSRQFPSHALRLLDAVIDNQPWVPEDLGQCLDAIASAAPKLARHSSYQRLREYERRRG